MAPKVVIALVIIVLFFILLSQNVQVVTLKFLFWKLSMSIIVLVALFTLLGLILGFLFGKRIK